MPIIKINNLCKKFDQQLAIDHLSASIPEGKITGLVGPDGAGKTTLIRLIAGLYLPTGGTIEVAGFDTVKQQEAIHDIMGYMPQKFGLYEDLTVEQNLNLYAELRNVSDRSSFDQLLKFTGLSPFKDRLAAALSGGMKQKLGLACSLMSAPKVLLLDEPSVGVDPISRRELWKMVYQLMDQGVSVIWSTSYLDEAEKCDEVLLLNEGKILYSGAPRDLTKRVDGRVFRISHIEKKRDLLKEMLANPAVIDGVIQGSDVRVVCKTPDVKLALPPGAKLVPTPSRFEDAFMDILGGITKEESPIGKLTPSITEKDPIAVEADGLTKKFGNFTAAHNITFKIKRGEIFGLLGPNGAGKTTTFKMMCGLLTPTSGTSFLNGLHLQEAPNIARAHLGYMSQKFSLYGTLSSMQNLNFFAGIYNLQSPKKIDELIKIFSLEPYVDTSADLLPLGFKQRLALSCAIIHAPDVLFLDEPTSGVDPMTRREFWQHLNALVEKGVTIVISTHFLDEAEYCDRIGLVYRSELIQIGTPDQLKSLAVSAENPSPTLEDAFIASIEKYDREKEHA